MAESHVDLQYGERPVRLDLTGLRARVLRPSYPEALPDAAAAFAQTVRAPVGAEPLAASIDAAHRVAIAIPDITRALPTRQLLEWIFAELAHVPAERFVVVSGTGTHRGHTEDEWLRMVGPDIYDRYRCVDSVSDDGSTHVSVGTSKFGYDVSMNREFAEADRHLLLGFIEPHFMAGFSGGYKASFPGVGALDAIMHYHNAENIGHPRSTWGVLDGNPTQDHLRAAGSLVPDCFLINITLDEDRAITGFFCGDPIEAHVVGCDFCRDTVMKPCDEPFPVVVTTNSGYPLDQNLYQAVKGICAASEVVAEGGLILAAARCNDGFPDHSPFKTFLHEHDSPASMLEQINAPGFRMLDQWTLQKLANVLSKARVGLYSELDPEDVRKAHLEPVTDLRARIDAELETLGQDAEIAVLPEGPLTIPYLRQPAGVS